MEQLLKNLKKRTRAQYPKFVNEYTLHATYLARMVKTLETEYGKEGLADSLLSNLEYHVKFATCHEVAINEEAGVRIITHENPLGREMIYTKLPRAKKGVSRNLRVRIIWMLFSEIVAYRWDTLEIYTPEEMETAGYSPDAADFFSLHCPYCGEFIIEYEIDPNTNDIVGEPVYGACGHYVGHYDEMNNFNFVGDDFEQLSETIDFLHENLYGGFISMTETFGTFLTRVDDFMNMTYYFTNFSELAAEIVGYYEEDLVAELTKSDDIIDNDFMAYLDYFLELSREYGDLTEELDALLNSQN